jgi:extradiol dioxygenase
MDGVMRLGYVGIESAKRDEWEAFADTLGFGTREANADGLYLCMDAQHHRLAIHPGEREALAYIGWDLGTEDHLEGMRARLERADLTVEVGKDELCEQRRVARLLVFEDPSGFRNELFCGALARPRPFRTGRPMVGHFVTGDQGMGHIVLAVPDAEIAREFYARTLGLRKSDDAAAGPMTMDFFHANPRHHTLAFIPFPGMRGLLHIMVEVDQLDDVGIALDLCQECGYDISITLGRHHNDRMVSFYVRTPSNFDIEYGWGAITVDDASWSTVRYDEASLWGHKFDPANLGGALFPVE